MCCRKSYGLPHQCAHWFAMTGLVGVRAPVHGCNARRFCQGCGLPHHLSALVRNDIHKPGRLAHLQSRVKCTTFLPKCVLATAGAYLSLACHCEERSDVAIRIPAETGRNKQDVGRIRRLLRIRPKCCFPLCAAARVTDCHTSVRTGSQ